MTRILSWDVGIKNLAYCLIEENMEEQPPTIQIIDWGVFNISAEDTCDFIGKANKPCTKGATHYSSASNLHFCGAHLKKYKETNEEEKFKKIQHGKDEFFQTNCQIPRLLDEHRELFLSCEHIVIENQPIFKNPKMKTIQMILYSYFLMRGITDKAETQSRTEAIQCFSATNKLKMGGAELNVNISTKDYKDRKKASIDLVTQLVANTPNRQNFFASHKKKDDLADSLLQALMYRRFHLNRSNEFSLIDSDIQ